MLRAFIAIATIFPALASAEPFQRPVPQPQSATAEWWFLGASIALLISLLAVHMLVRRR